MNTFSGVHGKGGPGQVTRENIDKESIMTPQEVVTFWRHAGMRKWFDGGDAFDAECRTRFEAVHFAASRREYEDWANTAEGSLALLILLDQIPRNIFRKSGHAFATDALALHYARKAVNAGLDQQVEPELRAFFYLPYEHSESMDDQRRSVELFEMLGIKGYLDYAKAHLDAIAQFGRFPHRNRALGRVNTPEEQAWLDAGGGF